MNYELAKQLKDAGFPQVWATNNPIGTGFIPTDYPYVPTLSELIEACGDGYFELKRDMEGWKAKIIPIDFFQFVSKGNTAEEAVANLWLALNKK